MSVFSQILIKDTPYLDREGEVCGVFCEFKFWISFVPVDAVLYTILCYIGTSYTGTQL